VSAVGVGIAEEGARKRGTPPGPFAALTRTARRNGSHETWNEGETHADAPPQAFPLAPGEVALFGVLATATMLFAGFTSAALVRRLSIDWVRVAPPPLLFVNLALIVLASIALELGRLRSPRGAAVPAAFLLGAAFLAGQGALFVSLSRAGHGLASSSHTAFFWVLGGAHALHAFGGLVGLGWAASRPAGRRERTLSLCRIYWHFLGVLWIAVVTAMFA
jgi:cytochrome c oxidase subunit III